MGGSELTFTFKIDVQDVLTRLETSPDWSFELGELERKGIHLATTYQTCIYFAKILILKVLVMSSFWHVKNINW